MATAYPPVVDRAAVWDAEAGTLACPDHPDAELTVCDWVPRHWLQWTITDSVLKVSQASEQTQYDGASEPRLMCAEDNEELALPTGLEVVFE